VKARVAEQGDLDAVVSILTGAFESDPLWSWAFPERPPLEAFWRLCVGSALRYPWVWVADDFAAASVWIPPGGTELTDEAGQAIGPMLDRLLAPRAPEVSDLLERFDAAHPSGPPHYYLSLLGTHPDRRGGGLGMSLLADNLARIDAEGMPAYLESSNPGNDSRYERLGFRRIGGFDRPDGKLTVATMWRQAR
jgi:GNAT superfamily N-acetyltransferase